MPFPTTYIIPSPLGSSTLPMPVPTGPFLGATILHLPLGIFWIAWRMILQLSRISSILTLYLA